MTVYALDTCSEPNPWLVWGSLDAVSPDRHACMGTYRHGVHRHSATRPHRIQKGCGMSFGINYRYCICGKKIREDDDFCSDECEAHWTPFDSGAVQLEDGTWARDHRKAVGKPSQNLWSRLTKGEPHA